MADPGAVEGLPSAVNILETYYEDAVTHPGAVKPRP